MNIILLLFYFVLESIELFTKGYLIIEYKKINKFINLPFFVRFPVYITTGLALKLIIYFIIGIVYVNRTLFLLIDLIFYFMFILFIYKNRFWVIKDIKSKSLLSQNILPLFLLIFGMIYVIFVSNYAVWPSRGDAMYHGAFTSLIIYNNRIPGSYSPFSTEKIQYPPGYSILASSVSILFGVYPGESVMMLGAYIISIIPSLMYSLTYLKSESLAFSITSYLAAYVIIPGENYRFLYGFFFNGTYPCLVGLALIITIFMISNYLKSSGNELGVFLNIFLLLCSLMIIFPVYVLYGIPYLLYIIYKEHSNIKNYLKNNIKNLIIIVVIISTIVYFVYKIYADNFYFITKFIIARAGLTPIITEYYLVPSFFYDNLNGAIIIISLLFIIMKLDVKNIKKIFEYDFFIVVSILTILSTNKYLYSYFIYILPRRSVILAILTGWVVFILNIHKLTELEKYFNIVFSIKKHKFSIKLKYIKRSISLYIILLLLIPSINQHLTFELTKEKSWFTRTEDGKLNYRIENDFSTMKWMQNNIDSKSLILNDMSLSSLYIPSFGMMNQTFIHLYNSSKYLELRKIWDDPYNSVFFYSLIEKYDVKYILVNSEWGYYESEKWGGDKTYHGKKYNYDKIFDIYPFLEIIYRSGDTKLYEIKKNYPISKLNISWLSIGLHKGKITSPKLTQIEDILNMEEVIIQISKGGNFGMALIYYEYNPPINFEAIDSISFNMRTNVTQGLVKIFFLAPDWYNFYGYTIDLSESTFERYTLFLNRLHKKGEPNIEQLGGIRIFFYSPGKYDLSSLYLGTLNSNNIQK